MIDCKRFAELLDSYIDGDISSADKASCYLHMSECASCKAEYEYTKSVYDALHTLPVPEVPASFLDDINKKIDEGAFEKKETRVRRIFRSPAAYSAAAAGLALVVIVGSGPWKLLRDAEKEPVHVDLPVTDSSPAGNKKQNGEKTGKGQHELPQPSAGPEAQPAQPEIPAAAEQPSVPVQKPDKTQAPNKTQPAATPKPKKDQYASVSKPAAAGTKTRPVQTPAASQAATVPASVSPQPSQIPAEAPAPVITEAPVKTEQTDTPKEQEVKQIPADKDIAVPSETYRVSDESDAANAAKIEHNRKLKESYALVESVDNMVYSPDVQQMLEDNGNIVINDAVYIGAIQGDTNALSSSVMVSKEDMDAVNKALEVFNFPKDDQCYFMTNEQLRQFLRTLDNLGVEYRHNAVNEDNQVVLKLITT